MMMMMMMIENGGGTLAFKIHLVGSSAEGDNTRISIKSVRVDLYIRTYSSGDPFLSNDHSSSIICSDLIPRCIHHRRRRMMMMMMME